MNFYDEIAEQYDAITGLAGRSDQVDQFIADLVQRYDIASAVDVACGQGVFTRALARQGVRACGVDISAEMLRQAERKAREESLDLQFRASLMQELDDELPHACFDLLLCMGNSLPHLLSTDDLDRSMGAFAAVVRPGGRVLIHLLNYRRLLDRRERIVGVTGSWEREYIRFYDFLDQTVRFNVLRIRRDGQDVAHDLISTELRPWVADDLCDAMRKAGFGQIECFGGLGWEVFDPADSDVLLMTAVREG